MFNCRYYTMRHLNNWGVTSIKKFTIFPQIFTSQHFIYNVFRTLFISLYALHSISALYMSLVHSSTQLTLLLLALKSNFKHCSIVVSSGLSRMSPDPLPLALDE